MSKQVNIDIPEGKEPVIDNTENGIIITWADKKLSYNDIYYSLKERKILIPPVSCYPSFKEGDDTHHFYLKGDALRKLVNIRNYFGKPKHFCDGVTIKCVNSYCGVETGQFYFDKPDLDSLNEVVFAKREHAEEAIRILGDELKLIFEPW